MGICQLPTGIILGILGYQQDFPTNNFVNGNQNIREANKYGYNIYGGYNRNGSSRYGYKNYNNYCRDNNYRGPDIRCFICNDPSHYVSACPKKVAYDQNLSRMDSTETN